MLDQNDTPPAPFELEKFLPYRIVKLGSRLSHAFSTIYEERFGITIPEWRIIAMLGERSRVIPTEISQLTFMDKAKVSRAIKLLSSKGLILKEPHQNDDRAYFLTLSPSGIALHQRLVAAALEWETEFLGVLSATNTDHLFKLLKKIESHLNDLDI